MPELIVRQDALLTSINDRLGGGPGEDIPSLGPEWMDDLFDVMESEAEEAETVFEDL